MTVAGRIRPTIKGGSRRLMIANFCLARGKNLRMKGGSAAWWLGRKRCKFFIHWRNRLTGRGLPSQAVRSVARSRNIGTDFAFGCSNTSSNPSFAPNAIPTVLEYTEADSSPDGLQKHETY